MKNSSKPFNGGMRAARRPGPSAIDNLILVLLCGIFLVAGCSRIGKSLSGSDGSGANSEQPAASSAPNALDGTTGVPECDEVLNMLSAEANDPDDGYIAKAIKATFLDKIRDSVKKSIEENKTDKVELAKNCRDFKAKLEKYKAEEKANKK